MRDNDDRSGSKNLPDETEGTHSDRLKISVAADDNVRMRSTLTKNERPYRLVISKVVPKIWARTNSAIAAVYLEVLLGFRGEFVWGRVGRYAGT